MFNPLNSIDGNSVAWMAENDRKNTASHEDQYRCPACEELVHDHEFIHELKVCKQCWEDKNGTSYISIDQAQHQIGDC